MTNATLTSLALLKVSIDQGNDYLEYLRPFVLEVLLKEKPEPVTDQIVTAFIREYFGLVIPQRTVQVALQRLAKQRLIKKIGGVYQIKGTLPDPDITQKRQEAERHIGVVVRDFTQFAKKIYGSNLSFDSAVTSICAFLAKFDITCLRAYLRSTVIPDLDGSHEIEIVLVSKFIIHLQGENPERFESFLRVVQGHMLANALLCPDLQYATKTYDGVIFYFDTPLLVRALGLEGTAKEEAVRELIRLLASLGGEVATLSHSREELDGVLRGAASKVDARDGRGAIVAEARRRSTSRSDLLLLAGRVDDELMNLDIHIRTTPPYAASFQIDETVFAQTLDDEVSYFNERARDYDINSVRSIYELRKGKWSPSVEKSTAILVTSNSAFARAAWQYGREHELSRDVSSVITDFSLANTAWLKAPMGAPTLPKVEVLAYSYAALQPSNGILNKFLLEVDKLEKSETISPRDHQLLRSDIRVNDELMDLTLGDEAALTEETISEILERVTAEIKEEETGRVILEKRAHEQTKIIRDRVYDENRKMLQAIYWRCYTRARWGAGVICIVICVLLLCGIVGGVGLGTNVPIVGWPIVIGSVVLLVLSVLNLVFGLNVLNIYEKARAVILNRSLKREAKIMGIDINDVYEIPKNRCNK